MISAGLKGSFDSNISTGRAALQSWLSMKNWVMAWLWYLNALYWVGLLFLDRAEAKWALVSYVAIGPIIAIMVVSQRGLTRLSGLIHIPWLVFTVYLGLRLYTEALGPRVNFATEGIFYGIWLSVVFWSTLICVVLDMADIVRWLKGERYVLGTPAAYAAGASKLTSTPK